MKDTEIERALKSAIRGCLRNREQRAYNRGKEIRVSWQDPSQVYASYVTKGRLHGIYVQLADGQPDFGTAVVIEQSVRYRQNT